MTCRREIWQYILRCPKGATTIEIAEALNIPMPRTSTNLSEMENRGYVRHIVEDRKYVYFAEPDSPPMHGNYERFDKPAPGGIHSQLLACSPLVRL